MHPMAFNWEIAMVLGVLLLAALTAGRIASALKLPRVTAYLFVGILLGSTLLARLGSDTPPHSATHAARAESEASHDEPFEPLTKLAISLVLFNLGCQFPLARARQIMRRVLRLSAGELTATFMLVLLGVMLVGQSWQGSLLLAALALATAPATTILVLKETESEGSLTEYTNALVAINNLVSIIVFEVFFLGLEFFLGGAVAGQATSALQPLGYEIGSLLYDLAGSTMIGVAGGLLISLSFSMVPVGRRLVLLLAVLLLGLAICELANMPYLLTFLAMGVTVANTSDQTRSVLAELDALTGLFCVVFFVAHGADLDLSKLGEAKLVGGVYVVMRLAGKYFGIRYAAKKGGEKREIQNWLGCTLTAQAGAAIALSSIAVQRTMSVDHPLHETCRQVQIVILGTVVVFEVIGPILIRQAVLRAGEVPLAQAINHPTTSLMDQWGSIVNRVMLALGRNPHKGRAVDDLTIGELMRKNPVAIPETATFDELVDLIEHSRDNVYPVVGKAGELVGLVRYRELSSVLFDPALGSLVRTADVMTRTTRVLHPEDSAMKAFDIFEHGKDDCLPIVAVEEPHQLVGSLRRRDILRLLIRGTRDS